jgi:hypothetical protein
LGVFFHKRCKGRGRGFCRARLLLREGVGEGSSARGRQVKGWGVLEGKTAAREGVKGVTWQESCKGTGGGSYRAGQLQRKGGGYRARQLQGKWGRYRAIMQASCRPS